MKALFYTFSTLLKRFRPPLILNILGLSIAFAASFIILVQVRFEYGYDKFLPNIDRLYRGSITIDGTKVAVLNPKLIRTISNLSPHIQCIAGFWLHSTNVSVALKDCKPQIFKESLAKTLIENGNVLGLEIVMGDKESLTKIDHYVIPECLAKKYYGDKNPIGQEFNGGTIGAVYRDLPDNSVIGPRIFYTPTQNPNEDIFAYVPIIRLSSPEVKQEVIDLINKKIEELYPPDGTKLVFDLTPLSDVYFTNDAGYDFEAKGNKTTTQILLLIAILVILVAIVNYINFTSAMAPVRIKTINLQRILGGSIWSLRNSLLMESVITVSISFLISLLLIYGLNSSPLSALLMADISLSTNLNLLLPALGFSLIIGLIAGLYPAFYMTSFAPILAIKGSFIRSSAGRWLRSILIAFQFIISIALIISTLFINKQNRYINQFNQGFDKEDIIFAEFAPALFTDKLDALQDAIRSCNEVSDVALAAHRFGCTQNYVRYSTNFNDDKLDRFYMMTVSPNFLDVMGINVDEGRNFNDTDNKLHQNVVIFNKCAQKSYNLELNQKFIISNDPYASGEIVGFAADGLHTLTLHQNDFPFAFQVGDYKTISNVWALFIRIKNNANKADAVENVKQKILDVNPLATLSLSYMDTATDELYLKDKKIGGLIFSFSILAILISLMGVFGLVMLETQHRHKEIGIRRVHGASIGSILIMFNAKFIRILSICFAIALPICYYILNRWLSSFTFRTPLRWWVFVMAFVLVFIITVSTVTLRSLSAATENPTKSIKTE